MVGIYEIIINGKSYVGQSNRIEKRLHIHLRALRNKKHKNRKLQNAFNVHDVVYTNVLETFEVVDKKLMYERETFWVSQKNAYRDGYNRRMPEKRWNIEVMTESRRKKLSESAKARGRTVGLWSSDEAKHFRMLWKSGVSIKQICEEYEIKRHQVSSILNMKSYTEPEAIPEGYIEWFEEIKEARARGERPTKRGWKHSDEFKEKFRKAVSKPNHHQRKLSDEQVQEILDKLAKGEKNGHLAREYNVSPQLISKIKRNNGR